MIEFYRQSDGNIRFRPGELAGENLQKSLREAELALVVASKKAGLALSGPPSLLARHPCAHFLAAYRKGLISPSELSDTPLLLTQLSKRDLQGLADNQLLISQDIRLLPREEPRGASFILIPIDDSAQIRLNDVLLGLAARLGPDWATFVQILRTVTFVDVASTPGLPYFSGSSNLMFGAMHMIPSDKPSILAECITHEAAHTWLGLIEGQECLAHSMWDEDRPFISPWRDDRRPIGGIVHGVFVFSCVLVALTNLIESATTLEDVPAMRRRIARIASQVEEGIDVLYSSGLLTKAGNQLCAESGDRMQNALIIASDEMEHARKIASEIRQQKQANSPKIRGML